MQKNSQHLLSVCVCTPVPMCVCVCVHLCMCLCVYVHLCMCVYTCAYVCIVCMYICVCVCTPVHMCVYTCACVCVHLCVCVYVCACVHMTVVAGEPDCDTAAGLTAGRGSQGSPPGQVRRVAAPLSKPLRVFSLAKSQGPSRPHQQAQRMPGQGDPSEMAPKTLSSSVT